MSETPKEKPTESEAEPRITYVGNPVNTGAEGTARSGANEVKQKNPKRVAAGKRLSALRKDKKRLLKGTEPENGENECESSAINVAYIAGIFGIVTGAIAV